ncbi:unnamed protein product [Vitrella brassicaformis CCMP3155]|uniref:SMB domain-containing protein n=1 Tax=Vitrella brassicaformis (strain CCMP3155) TaxID=1169540 RepID=A0A0G4GVQ6_VITBC|nr:unnamed protein product [Vitrella brassicaformis CCMP3155]|eukprot:CEM35033.1 unnamed protein product [Vitrella brassicaformis CCMP3155]
MARLLVVFAALFLVVVGQGAPARDTGEVSMHPEHPESPHLRGANERNATAAVRRLSAAIGESCSSTSDCDSDNCVNGWCWPTDTLAPHGHRCNFNNDCCSDDCDDDRCDSGNSECDDDLYVCMVEKTPKTEDDIHKFACVTDLSPGAEWNPIRLSGDAACTSHGWSECERMEVSCHNNNTPEAWSTSGNSCSDVASAGFISTCAYRAVCK